MRELLKEVGLLQLPYLRQEGSLDMCEISPQGGLRCYSNSVESLVSAEAKYQGVLQEWAEVAALSIARPGNLRARKLEAQYDLFDARVRHASTPQGEADLSARVHQLAHGGLSHLLGTRGRDLGMTDDCAFAKADTDYLECIAAIAEGIRMRERNEDIADVNVNNQRTPQQGAEFGRYPDAREQHIREAAIARVERQSAGIKAHHPAVAA